MAVATPPQAPRLPNEQDLSKGLKWSLIVHLGLGVAALLKSLVFPSKPITYVPTLRVDLVGLPDILKKDLNKVPKLSPEIAEALKQAEIQARKTKAPEVPAPKSKSEPADPDEMVLNPKKAGESTKKLESKNKSALARIKALEKIKSLESEESKSAPLIKGNAISRGTSLDGDARESDEANYIDSLRALFKDNWELPVWLARQNLSARVEIRINGKGQLQGFKFVKNSGNAQFDELVKRTLTESQPYPIPPKELQNQLRFDGILVGFPL